jgi:hypothetical protein
MWVVNKIVHGYQNRRFNTFVILAAVSACTVGHPQTAPAPLEPNPTPIAAPVSRTWDALVETLVTQQIPTKTVAKESGLLESGPMSLESWGIRNKEAVAGDCGFGQHAYFVGFTFLVRGDSANSTLLVTPHYTGDKGGACKTTGQWESTIAKAVRARAEGKSTG